MLGLPPVAALDLSGVEASERDTTQDWLLSDEMAPPLLGELEERIEEAVASAVAAEESAKAAEEEVHSVGVAALNAARQATKAAETAERAAEAAERASGAALDASQAAIEGPPEDNALRSFSERADRVVARLRALERLPRRPRVASAASGRSRGDD
jgi:hypothetical protein